MPATVIEDRTPCAPGCNAPHWRAACDPCRWIGPRRDHSIDAHMDLADHIGTADHMYRAYRAEDRDQLWNVSPALRQYSADAARHAAAGNHRTAALIQRALMAEAYDPTPQPEGWTR